MQIDGGRIDEDHKQLFEIANRILKVNAPDRDTGEIQALIRELYSYVQEHFEREEAYMESLGYPELKAHKKIHATIVQDMNRSLNESYHLGQVLGSFRQLVTTWVLEHILQEDRKIYAFIVENE
jgi:hemerythrin